MGATAPYAVFQEFGTRFMSAAPFIRPAVDAYFGQAVQAIAEGIMKGDVLVGLEETGANMESLARELVRVDTGYLQSTIYHRVG